jgi:hypothetical protein
MKRSLMPILMPMLMLSGSLGRIRGGSLRRVRENDCMVVGLIVMLVRVNVANVVPDEARLP